MLNEKRTLLMFVLDVSLSSRRKSDMFKAKHQTVKNFLQTKLQHDAEESGGRAEESVQT